MACGEKDFLQRYKTEQGTLNPWDQVGLAHRRPGFHPQHYTKEESEVGHGDTSVILAPQKAEAGRFQA